MEPVEKLKSDRKLKIGNSFIGYTPFVGYAWGILQKLPLNDDEIELKLTIINQMENPTKELVDNVIEM